MLVSIELSAREEVNLLKIAGALGVPAEEYVRGILKGVLDADVDTESRPIAEEVNVTGFETEPVAVDGRKFPVSSSSEPVKATAAVTAGQLLLEQLKEDGSFGMWRDRPELKTRKRSHGS